MNDLSGIEQYIPHLAQWLGVEPATALLFVGIIVMVANLTGRLIPDDKTGVLGAIRKLCKFIGFYASNRIASGLTVNEIAKTTVPIIEQVGTVQEQMESKMEAFGGVVEAFPGFSKGPARDPATGKFAENPNKKSKQKKEGG